MEIKGFTNPNPIGEIPNGWQVCSIDSLCLKVTSGGTPLRSNRAFYANGTIRWLKTQELKDWYIDDSEEKITLEAVEKSSAKVFPVNTVLMAMYGDGKTITSLGILRKEAATNQACCALIANPDICYYLYLFYALKYHRPDFIHIATGGAQRNLSGTLIRNFAIKVPPLPEQKAIAHILGTLDDKIELNREMNRTLEAMARAIFKSWFVDFDPVRAKMEGRQPAGMDAATAELFPDEFEDSVLGAIPKGWRVGKIDNCTSLIIDYRGKTPNKLQGDWSSSGIPAISAKNIKSGRLVQYEAIRYVDPELFERWMKDSLAIGDIIMTSEAPLGELFYLARNANYCLSQRLFGIRSDNKTCKSIYLYHALGSSEVQAQIQSRATGTTVLGIRQTELRKVHILLPPIVIQQKVALHLENYIVRVQLNEEENKTLASIRDTLLPKLLSGEIRVKDAEKVVEAVA